MYTQHLDSSSSQWKQFSSRYLAKSKDTFFFGWGLEGTSVLVVFPVVEAGDAANHSAMHRERPHSKDLPGLKHPRCQVEKSCSVLISCWLRPIV